MRNNGVVDEIEELNRQDAKVAEREKRGKR
jgi:hypothetical protein